jgi:hypothetical protein
VTLVLEDHAMLHWIAAAAVASPLDEAMADGRPVIVLVDRADRAPFGVWLFHATGAARERVDAVALVLATPDDLTAWLGAPVPETADLVRLDPARQVAGYADVAAAPVLRAGAGAAEETSPRAPARPDARPTAQRRNRDITDVVYRYDRSLRSLIRRVPLSSAHAVTPHPTSPTAVRPHPAVHGATWCNDSGCGVICEQSKPVEAITTTVFNPETGETQITGYAPSGMMCGVGQVEREVAMFLQRWDGG